MMSNVGDLISGFAQNAAVDAGADGLDVEITYDIDIEVGCLPADIWLQAVATPCLP